MQAARPLPPLPTPSLLEKCKRQQAHLWDLLTCWALNSAQLPALQILGVHPKEQVAPGAKFTHTMCILHLAQPVCWFHTEARRKQL